MVWLANEVQQLGGARPASKTIKSGHSGLIRHFLARYQSVNMDKSCEMCLKSFATPFSFRRHMQAQHNVITKSAWNKRKTLNKACGVRLVTPNVTHVTPDVTPNVAQVTPDVTHVTRDVARVTTDIAHVTHVRPDVAHVTPDVAHVTPDVTHVTPDAAHVTPDVTHNMSYATAKEKCLSSNTASFGLQSKPKKFFVFRHPFTMLLAGPTSCDKTTWMKKSAATG